MFECLRRRRAKSPHEVRDHDKVLRLQARIRALEKSTVAWKRKFLHSDRERQIVREELIRQMGFAGYLEFLGEHGIGPGAKGTRSA